MNIQYDNILNERIYKRNIPSKTMKPNYDYRPMSTKYLDIKKKDPNETNEKNEKKDHNETNEKKEKLFSYTLNTNTIFNPGYRGEVDTYFYNIDKESELRNQFMALQKDIQSHYIPNENSDLYKNTMEYSKQYTKYESNHNKNYNNLAPLNFNNSTRYNIKNL